MNEASRSGRGWWWEKEAAAKEAEQRRLATEHEEVTYARARVATAPEENKEETVSS